MPFYDVGGHGSPRHTATDVRHLENRKLVRPQRP